MGGTPIALKCPRCIRRADIYDMRAREAAARGIVKIEGQERTVYRRGAGPGHKSVQVRHERCGHVWWTLHPDVTGNRPIRRGPGA